MKKIIILIVLIFGALFAYKNLSGSKEIINEISESISETSSSKKIIDNDVENRDYYLKLFKVEKIKEEDKELKIVVIQAIDSYIELTENIAKTFSSYEEQLNTDIKSNLNSLNAELAAVNKTTFDKCDKSKDGFNVNECNHYSKEKNSLENTIGSANAKGKTMLNQLNADKANSLKKYKAQLINIVNGYYSKAGYSSFIIKQEKVNEK